MGEKMIPISGGVYILEIHLIQPQEIQIGRLGKAVFKAGKYLYVGSARGPGGLFSRLKRHLVAGNKRIHWHIDYLRKFAMPVACAFQTLEKPGSNLSEMECTWSQSLQALPGASIPMQGFGASDCRRGCKSHLIHFSATASNPSLVSSPEFLKILANSSNDPHPPYVVQF